MAKQNVGDYWYNSDSDLLTTGNLTGNEVRAEKGFVNNVGSSNAVDTYIKDKLAKNMRDDSDYSSLKDAISDIGSEEVILNIHNDYKLSNGETLTIPSNITLNPKGGVISGDPDGWGVENLILNCKLLNKKVQLFNPEYLNFTFSGFDEVCPEIFGAKADLVTYDTLALNTAIQSVKNILYITSNYLTEGLFIENKSDLLITGGGKLKIDVDEQSILGFKGDIENITIENLTLFGTANPLFKQGGIDNISGQNINNITVRNLTIYDLNVGISINSELSGSATNCNIENNYLKNIVGTETGQGYGIHIATGGLDTAPYTPNQGNIFIRGNVIDNASRHAIYIAHTNNVTVVGNTILNHRKDVYNGAIRVALAISRSCNVSVFGNHFTDCYGGCLMVVREVNRISHNTIISGNTFVNFPEHGIFIGYSDPANSSVRNVIVENNTFEPDEGTASQNSIVLYSGSAIKVRNNIIGLYDSTYDSYVLGINLYGTTEDYADNLKNVEVTNNIINLDGIHTKGINVGSYICSGDNNYLIKDNLVRAATKYSYISTPKNPNMTVTDVIRCKAITVVPEFVAGSPGFISLTNYVRVIFGYGYITNISPKTDWWSFAGVSTGAGEYRRVLLTMTRYQAPDIIVGDVGTSSVTSPIPKCPDVYSVPLGIVEIPPNYSGGDLTGFLMYGILGNYDV